jgi:hypothetical protein
MSLPVKGLVNSCIYFTDLFLSLFLTRCEKETSEVELHDMIPVYLDNFQGVYLRKEHM